jgi:hypothetical protein
MSRENQRGNREMKKPKKEKPKETEAGYKSKTAMLTSTGSKGITAINKKQK